jgi:hypothetical protein
MKRSLLIAVLGIFATLAMMSVCMYLCLLFTPWGRAVSGRSGMPPDWGVIWDSGYYGLLLYVFAPPVITVGFLVGLFAKRFPLLVAVLSTSPVPLITFGSDVHDLLVTSALVFCAVGAAYLATCWRSRRRTRPQEAA